MEYYKALKLREEWGDKPCDHPKLEKVYFTGAFLLNYACMQCGAEFTVAQKLERDLERKRKIIKIH
jgi:hypothetical protein